MVLVHISRIFIERKHVINATLAPNTQYPNGYMRTSVYRFS